MNWITRYKDYLIGCAIVAAVGATVYFVTLPGILLAGGIAAVSFIISARTLGVVGIALLVALGASILSVGNDSALTSNISQLLFGAVIGVLVQSLKPGGVDSPTRPVSPPRRQRSAPTAPARTTPKPTAQTTKNQPPQPTAQPDPKPKSVQQTPQPRPRMTFGELKPPTTQPAKDSPRSTRSNTSTRATHAQKPAKKPTSNNHTPKNPTPKKSRHSRPRKIQL